MTNQAVLGTPYMSAGQDQKYQTFNDALDAIALYISDPISIDMTSASYTLSAAELQQNVYFSVENVGTTGRTLTLNATTHVKKIFIVKSDDANSDDIDVVNGSTAITMQPGDISWFYCDGTANGLVQIGASGTFDPTSSINFSGSDTFSGGVALTSTMTLSGSGAIVGGDKVLSQIEMKDWDETIVAKGTTNGAIAFDFSAGNVQTITLNGNLTASFTNPPPSSKHGRLRLIITQDGSGGHTYTWPGSVVWPFATTPTLPTTASAVVIVDFVTPDAGTTWYGKWINQRDFDPTNVGYTWGGAQTFSATVTMSYQQLVQPQLKSYSIKKNAKGNISGAVTIDYSDGNVQTVTLTGNVTSMTISNPPASGQEGRLTLYMTQDSTPRSVVWPSGTIWASGTPPTISPGSGAKDVYILTTFDGGTSWYGFVGGQAFA